MELKFAVALFFLATTCCFAQSDSQGDLAQYRNYVMIYMKKYETQQLPMNRPQYGNGSPSGAYRAAGKTNYGYSKLNNFKEGDNRNWVKSGIMQNVGVLAQALAGTAGTAFAFDSSNQLRSNASQLIATGDPTLKQMGTQLNQEATQVEQGDQVGATNTANQIASTPRPVVSQGYQPGPQESQFVQALSNSFAMIIQSVTGILGVQIASQFVQLLFGGGSGGGLFSGILANGTTNLLNGQAPSSVASNTSVNAVYAGGGLAQQSINTNLGQKLVAPPPVSGQSSGGVPSP